MAKSKTPKHSELNAKRKVFCEEYLVDLNATQAVIRAGYSKKTANRIASKLLSEVVIKEYIHELIEKRSKNVQITSEAVLKELGRIAFGNMKDFIQSDKNGIKLKNIKDLTPEQLGIISEFNLETNKKAGKTTTNTKFKLYPKDNALVTLMRHLGMFEKDNMQQGIKIRVTRK